MMSRSRGVLINQKLALLFTALALLTLVCFGIVYVFQKNTAKHRKTLDEYVSIERGIQGIWDVFEQVKKDGEDDKIRFKEALDQLEQSFNHFVYRQLEGKNDTLIKDGHVDLSHLDGNLPDDQKALLTSTEFWYLLEEPADKIKFNNLHTDSTYLIYVEQVTYLPPDSLHPRGQEVLTLQKVKQTKRVPSEDGARAYLVFKANLLQLEKEFAHLHIYYTDKYEASLKRYRISVILICAIFLVIIVLSFMYAQRIIVSPLRSLSKDTNEIVKGNLRKRILIDSGDEIAYIGQSINTLADDISKATAFVQQIKSGNLEENIDISKGDNGRKTPLAEELLSMRNQMKTIAMNETQRNWTIEGQAILSEVLSKNYNDFNHLVDEVINKLVQYLGATQGGLFVISDSEASENQFLELVSCYAFDRKKFVSKKVMKGEGLVGQVWQEEKTSYMENVPEDHTSIKSALGDAQPVALLIVPLVDNGIIYGVVELASFKKMERYHVEFVEKIGESIASTLSSVEINNKTQMLLKDSQDLTRQMKEQEEMMLKNLEELQAEQDEITRREFQKDNELKLFTEKYDTEVAKASLKEEKLQKEIEDLKDQVTQAQTDNSKIRELNAQIEDLEKVKIDLEETLKIKDMRITKMRKKLDRLQGD